MTLFQFYTTLPANKIPDDFQHKTYTLLSQVLNNKPSKIICIHLFADQTIYTGNILYMYL